MTVDLAQVLSVAVQLTVLIAAGAGFIVWLRRWLQAQVAGPTQATLDQVAPNGGSQESTRHLIEKLSTDLHASRQDQADLLGTVSALAERADTNQELATKALDVANQSLTIARETTDRLDRHLERWGEQDHRP